MPCLFPARPIDLSGSHALALWLCCALAAPASAEVDVDCIVRPNLTVQVASPVDGVLSEVSIRRGDRVAAGQVIARVEDSVERAGLRVQERRAADRSSLEAQQTRAELAKTRAERLTQLFKRGVTTQEELDQAQAEFAVALAESRRVAAELEVVELERALSEALLSLRTVRSPITGVVTSRNLAAGEYAQSQNAIAEIAALDPLHVEAFLPVRYADQIALGQTGRVTLRLPKGATRDARVTVLDAVFDAASDSFGVRLEMANPDAAVAAGQRCALRLDIDPVEPEHSLR